RGGGYGRDVNSVCLSRRRRVPSPPRHLHNGLTKGDTLAHSKSAINRAGDLLRKWQESADLDGHDLGDLNDAYAVLADFRSSFAYPLTKVAMGLRSMVSCEADTTRVAQRLK